MHNERQLYGSLVGKVSFSTRESWHTKRMRYKILFALAAGRQGFSRIIFWIIFSSHWVFSTKSSTKVEKILKIFWNDSRLRKALNFRHKLHPATILLQVKQRKDKQEEEFKVINVGREGREKAKKVFNEPETPSIPCRVAEILPGKWADVALMDIKQELFPNFPILHSFLPLKGCKKC